MSHEPLSPPVYADADPTAWLSTLAGLRSQVAKAVVLEDAARAVARELAETYAASTALARVYAVVPYAELEPAVRAFVDALVDDAGAIADLRPTTPVLVLLGTHGAKPAWCDRRQSVGHRGIPLLSASFVEAIPMVARLLKELGVELAWLDDAPEIKMRKLLGGFNGVFFVEDAATALDSSGRQIIPAQAFVEEQGVRTVFGMGGVYPDGTLLAIIVFAREHLQRSQVERLTSLISLFKGETFAVVRARKFFGA